MSKNKKSVIQKKENKPFVYQEISGYSGPIPQPKDMAEYEKILPGSAHRIMTMAEKDQDIHKNFIAEELKFQKRGQIFGFILVFFFLLPVLIYSNI